MPTEIKQLVAFHGKESIKKKYLSRVRAHRVADEIIQGTTWTGKKGCAVGCTLHAYDHLAYERELGIPMMLARLEDSIFEGLSVNDSKAWPEDFLNAIPVGADLSMIWPRFALYLIIDKKEGVIRFAKRSDVKKALREVASLFQEWISTGIKPSDTKWREAAQKARTARSAAAAWAAEAAEAAEAAAAEAEAAWAAEAEAAWAAAEAEAAWAAEAEAAWAAAEAEARWAARKNAREQTRALQAKKLLQLLAEAPVLEAA
jgi:hypothetical protein